MNLYKIFLFILVLTTWLNGGQWVIDTLPTSGYYYSMVIDSNGVPVIGYNSGKVSCAKYISGYGWLIQNIDTEGYAYSYNVRWLAAGKNGSLHAAYEHYNGSYSSDLKYAKWNGVTWISEAVTGATNLSWIYDISIVVDSNDNPHIAYYDGNSGDYKYINNTGTGWSSPSVMPGSSSSAGLAIDGGNTIHTAYYSGSLYYAKKDAGGSWSSPEIVTNDGGWNCSIAVSPSGMVAIAYQDSNEDLKCAIKIGNSWQIYNVDVGDEKVGNYISVAIDSISNVHIVYDNYSFDDLKYAKLSAGTWNVQTIDSIGKVGDHCSIAINTQNNPCIAYDDETNNRIKYAYWSGGPTSSTTDIPANIKLRNNSFKPEKGEKMEIECELFQSSNLKINIYNLKNELIKTVVDENRTEGKYSEFWEGINSRGEIVGSGLYFVVIEVGSHKIVKKAVVIK